MVKTGQVQHQPAIQYGGSKPEVVNKSCERRITCSISSVLH